MWKCSPDKVSIQIGFPYHRLTISAAYSRIFHNSAGYPYHLSQLPIPTLCIYRGPRATFNKQSSHSFLTIGARTTDRQDLAFLYRCTKRGSQLAHSLAIHLFQLELETAAAYGASYNLR